jgi:hypothetical protein
MHLALNQEYFGALVERKGGMFHLLIVEVKWYLPDFL